MIEIASYPSDYSKLDREKPFYLELFGETEPLIDMNFAQLVPGGSVDTVAQSETLTPVYQYWWTLGYMEGLRDNEDPAHTHSFNDETEDLMDSDVYIYMYFPINGGWRIKEVIPTVRYLKPLNEQIALWGHASELLNQAAPAISGIAGIAPLARAIPTPVTAAISFMPVLLSTFAKLHINTVPAEDGFAWSVKKVTYYREELGLLQGIVWTIPKKMYRELGARLTGSLSVCFIPAHVQQKGTIFASTPEFLPKPILTKATIHSSGLELPDPHKFPGEFPDGFLRLYIAPHTTDTNAST